MFVIAHRGANKEAPENSWTAFDKAIESGSERLELDVRETRDGHAIVIHDRKLDRTTDKKGLVAEFDRADLKDVTLADNKAIPFLDEVLERYLDQVEINIEIKGPSESLARAVANLAGDHRHRDKIIVSSFCLEPLAWLAKHCPELKRACLWGTDTLKWPNLSLFAPQIFMEKADTRIIHPNALMVDQNFMDQAGLKGWQVYSWIEMNGEDQDREGVWSHLKTLGVHGHCTNYPRQLTEWLKDASLDEHFNV